MVTCGKEGHLVAGKAMCGVGGGKSLWEDLNAKLRAGSLARQQDQMRSPLCAGLPVLPLLSCPLTPFGPTLFAPDLLLSA